MMGRFTITPRRRPSLAALGLALTLALPACKKDQGLQRDEKLKTVVAADRKLEHEQENLLARRGTLQRERRRIHDKRTALITKKLALTDGDTQGKQALEQEVSKLVSLESRLTKQEITVNTQLQTLQSKKSDLVGQLKGAANRALMMRRRESSVANREKDIGRREHELARREKVLAEREQSLAIRQARICPRGGTTTVVQRIVTPRRSERSYGRNDVEPVYRAAREAMRKKGVLIADLPPGVDRLVTQIRHSVAKKKYTQAKFAADQLLASVRGIRVNRVFIGGKIARLSRQIRKRPPRGSKKTRVSTLFQRATAAYGDGRFSAANRLLNKIYGLLG